MLRLIHAFSLAGFAGQGDAGYARRSSPSPKTRMSEVGSDKGPWKNKVEKSREGQKSQVLELYARALLLQRSAGKKKPVKLTFFGLGVG